MKLHPYIIFSLLFLGFFACAEKDDDPDNGNAVDTTPVSNPENVVFKQVSSVDGYTVEAQIPWKDLGITPEVNVLIGFDIVITDDDDGGLADKRLAWKMAEDKAQPSPSAFGTLKLIDGNGQGDNLLVQKAITSVIVDGKAEDLWTEIPPEAIEKKLKGTTNHQEDFAGNFKALWDDDNLYLLVSVTDNQKLADSRLLLWEDDGVAINLDPKNLKAEVINEADNFQYRVAFGNNDVTLNNYRKAPTWTIPQADVFDGGPGKDGIPALENPEMVPAPNGIYLSNDDLVIGYVSGNDARAYPHDILDWHEIINDEVNGRPIAITYCPLTGTAIGWNREINGEVTTFGVSGLLYNTNLIPYDRRTNSNWSQQGLDCVNGDLQGVKIETFQVVETTWETWKKLYPDTKVVSTNTGFSRSYGTYPYDDYRTNHNNLIFPVEPDDSRLPRKERVHGIIMGSQAKVYPIDNMQQTVTIIQDVFNGTAIVVAGSKHRNFAVSFERTLEDGTILDFFSAFTGDGPVILTDNEGNRWNIFGEAVEGPRTGQRLTPTESFIGYWFSWGAFYPNAQIYL